MESGPQGKEQTLLTEEGWILTQTFFSEDVLTLDLEVVSGSL